MLNEHSGDQKRDSAQTEVDEVTEEVAGESIDASWRIAVAIEGTLST
jgi:hypothetical protein